MEYYEKMCSLASDPSKKKSSGDLELLDLLKTCELFCIHPNNPDATFLEGEDKLTHDPDGYKGELDIPFKTIWVEMGKLNGLKYKLTVDYNQYKSHEPVVNCIGLLVHETTPKVFRMWGLFEVYGAFDDPDKKQLRVLETSTLSSLAQSMIDRINKETWGLEAPKTKLKIGTGNLKEIRRIRRVIHVTTKRNTKNIKDSHKKIDWSHAWTVRGHWRIIKGIGKDREDVEGIIGHTWIKSYLKGAGEFIKKTRIIK
jgi:hypothetical protein